MAVSFDGFSIRGYTSKMRSIDVMKCWPFGGGGDGEGSGEVSRKDVESWLPPMTVPQFRFWSNELETLRSNQYEAGKGKPEDQDQPSEEEVSRSDVESESVRSDRPVGEEEEEEEKLEMVCPVCRDFNAATLTAVNAHIDGCLAQTMKEERRQQMRMMSPKSKPLKKRSIAEIFEVKEKEEEEEEEQQQPQIETVLKFWPFSKEPDEVSITVTKFRWLSRRLEALRSNREGNEISRSGKELLKSDEGVSAVEEEKLEMICPVCRDFNAATVTAVNAHIDGCLAQAVREERWQMRKMCSKPKPKAPKKRSIAEILTVAPPINSEKNEVVEVEKEDENDEVERKRNEEKLDCNGGGDSTDAAVAAAVASNIKSKKSTKKNTKKKVVMKKKSKVKTLSVPLSNKTKKMKKGSKKNKKKTKNLFNNELTAKKDGAYKRKVLTPENSCSKLKDTIGNKTVALADIDAPALKKKVGLKMLSVEKKQKVTNCDSVGKQQKARSPVRGILKNRKEHISGGTSSCCNIQDGIEESHCGVQVPTSDRLLRFCGKDDILGPKGRNSFDETVFNLSSDSSESDEGTANLEANGNDVGIAVNMDERKVVCSIVEGKQFSTTQEQGTVQNFLGPSTNEEKSKHLVEKSESESLTPAAFCDNNLHLSDRGKTTTVHCSPYADISRPLSALKAGQVSGTNTEACNSGAFSSNGKFSDHLENPTFQAANMISNSNTRPFLKAASSLSAPFNKANERPEFPLYYHGDNHNNGRALGGRLVSRVVPSHGIDNSFPFPSWGKGSVRNNCMDQNFFGLPLNSHGELINFSSSGKLGMNQPEISITLGGSLSGLSVNDTLHQSGEEYLSISERHGVQKTIPKDRVPHYPARLGVTDLPGSGRADIHRVNSDRGSNHYVQPLDSGLNLMRNPFIEHNQRDKVQNHKGNGMISPEEISDLVSPSSSQPTMRLMGKDVPIGRSNQEMPQYVRGDISADEELSRRHSEDAARENSSSGRCFKQDWISGSPLQLSTENVLQSVKIESSQPLQSTLMMKGPDSEFHDMQGNHVSHCGSLGAGNLGVSRSASSYLHPITQASTSCAVFNRAPDRLPEQFIFGAKHLGFNPQSQVLPTHLNFGQHASLSNGELNERRKHHHVANSSFEFPFWHPVVEEHDKTSWFQRSHRSLPPWMLSSTSERPPGTSSQEFSAVCSKSFPQDMWGNNFTTPSVNHSARVLYPSNSLTSHRPRNTSLFPASIVQPLHASVTSVTKLPSAINSGCRNTIVTDRVKLDDMITKDHRYPCSSFRKRPAANIDDPTKPIKLPNIEVQENLSGMTGMTRENSSTELQRNTRAGELGLQVDSAIGNEAQDLNPRSYLGVDSSKLDGAVISGPVKLCPGAKHILKPSQNMDQDNSRPIHSAIPFAATTDCGRDLEIQRKLTKVYKF